MIKRKSILSLIMLLFCIIMLCGCANVDYSRFIDKDGKTTDRIVVEIDDAALKYCNISKQDLLRNIKEDLDNYYCQPVEDFQRMYRLSGRYTTEQIAMVLEEIHTNVEIIGNKVVCDVVFDTGRAFRAYYPPTDYVPDVEFREGTFVNKYVQSSTNVYAALKTDTLKSIINKYRGFFGNKYNLEDVKFTQEYASPDTQIHSNADSVQTVQGIKMHYWEISASNLDFQLEFYTVSPHTSSWYILALIITLIITVLVWVMIVKKKSNKEE